MKYDDEQPAGAFAKAADDSSKNEFREGEPMRKKFIAGNWKMHGSLLQIELLIEGLLAYSYSSAVQTIVFPPFPYLSLVQQFLEKSPIHWGAQNVYPAKSGAFTGEVSAPMLKEFQCRYVLVGHSERRHLFKENEKFIAEKFHHVKEHGMIPILCIGETLKERQKGLTKQVLQAQLEAVMSLPHAFDESMIAYEPVWAIGTGKSALPQEVQAVHEWIREFLANNKDSAAPLPLLYGGSVNEKNAASLLDLPDVDGALVGGASLNAQQFLDIIKCIN